MNASLSLTKSAVRTIRAEAEARSNLAAFTDAMSFALLDLSVAIDAGDRREIVARFDIVSRVFKTGID